MTIAFFHTADVHVGTFDKLLDQLRFEGERTHTVMPELLSRARQHGIDSVRSEVMEVLIGLVSADAVVCTCSTLGPIADELAKQFNYVFRVDRPVMEEACKLGQDILVAICLESTKAGTLELLNECARAVGAVVTPRVVLCDAAWPYFERGDTDGFAASIAKTIRIEISGSCLPDCILLAQASMRVAETKLSDLNLPVISSPYLATERAIKIVKSK